jgi:spermidine/putrescine transport system permease protein
MSAVYRWAPWIYLAIALLFIFLPVLVLVQFSFQGGMAPVPPFDGPSLKWWGKVLANRKITDGLWNSLLVGLGSASVATVLAFSRRIRWRGSGGA